MPSELAQEQCQLLAKGAPALDAQSIQKLLALVADWRIDQRPQHISKVFTFRDYYQTIAFVNAVAWIAEQQNHHPELQVSYKQCNVTYTTHSVNGLSRNDFICAAKIDALLSNS